jgi:glycosyltransferase involved in cell wall biosynthesis
MKKLVVITNLLPHYQINFFNKLIEINHKLDLTVFADIECNSSLNNYKEELCNFNVINSPMKNRKGIVFRKSIKKKIDDINPDYIVFYGSPREFSLSTLMIYYWLTSRKFNVHGMFHRIGGQTLFSKTYYRFIGLAANKCFTYSRKGAEVLLDLGVKSRKIKIIGTAIDEKKSIYHKSQINEEMLNDFKKENGLLNKKLILQVVRLSRIKKPDMLLKVAIRLQKSHPDIMFVIIGGGELYEEMQDEIQKLGLSDAVLLLGPIYNEEILSYWFSAASVFVMPTCIGLSAHHAFSYSLPVITDDDLLNQASEFEILADGLNCLLYEAGNIKSFEEKILAIIDDPCLQSFLSKNALHTVKYVHSLDDKCQNYLNALFD